MFTLVVNAPHGPIALVRGLEFCHAVLLRERWWQFGGVECSIVEQRTLAVAA